MFWLRRLVVHLLALGLFGWTIVATPIPLNVIGFVVWVWLVTTWAWSWPLTRSRRSAFALVLIQTAGMSVIVLAAIAAPVKVIDGQKSRMLTLPKQTMTLDELSKPIEHGWARPYSYFLEVPKGLGAQPVQFPARDLTVGEFISSIEKQAPLRHRFHHCGNGYTILEGGDCSFGLHFRKQAGLE